MKYNILVRFSFIFINYSTLLFSNWKWDKDGLNIYKLKINRKLQPILFAKNKFRRTEIGLLIYEDYCHIFTIIAIFEFFTYLIFQFYFLDFLTSFIIYFSSLAFLIVFIFLNDIKEIKEKRKQK